MYPIPKNKLLLQTYIAALLLTTLSIFTTTPDMHATILLTSLGDGRGGTAGGAINEPAINNIFSIHTPGITMIQYCQTSL